MLWKGKIERNTMQVFLDWCNASGGSYLKKTVKMFQFCWFFEFFAYKKIERFKNFCASYFMYCNEAVCKSKRPIQIITPKLNNIYFGPIFREDTNFLQFWPIKLSLIISKLL